jgi:serine/threonine protein kinase
VCWGEKNNQRIVQKKLNVGDSGEEIEILQNVKDKCRRHKGCHNVIKILDSGCQLTREGQQQKLIYTPYYDQGSLEKWITGKRLSNIEFVTKFTNEIRDGIMALHGISYAHCDMKPANVMIHGATNPRAIIGDLGTLTKMGKIQKHPQGGHFSYGDMNYMRSIDHGATPVSKNRDLFAWVLTVYEMVVMVTKPWVPKNSRLPPRAEDFDSWMQQQHNNRLVNAFRDQHPFPSLVAYSSKPKMSFGCSTDVRPGIPLCVD